MTHADPPTLAARNDLDEAIGDAQHLAEALNRLADHLIPEQDDEIRDPLFAVLDALRDKLGEVGKLIERAP